MRLNLCHTLTYIIIYYQLFNPTLYRIQQKKELVNISINTIILITIYNLMIFNILDRLIKLIY